MHESAIFFLPRDVLALVANFLLPENEQNKRIFKYSFDWRNFMNSSKEHLTEWKHRSQIVALTPSSSEKYRISSVFRETVSQIIINPLEQLELKLDCEWSNISLAALGRVKRLDITDGVLEDYPVLLDELILFSCGFEKKLEGSPLKDCPPIRKLRIDDWGFSPICLDVAKDFPLQLLQSLREVSLTFVKIENYFQGFSHLESLSISHVPSLTYVNCFGTIPKLTFKGCKGIRDVSALGKSYYLDLSYCDNIKDVSALGNVRILNLNYCYLVTEVSALKNVYQLHIEGFQGEELLGLKNVVKLFLQDSCKVTDLSPLRKVQMLDILNCTQISHFHPLEEYGNLTEMSIGGKFLASKFAVNSGKAVFERLIRLELEYVHPDELETDFSLPWGSFKNVRELVLRECEFTSIPMNSFSHLQSLKLLRCGCIRNLPTLPSSLGTLIIEECYGFVQLNLLSSCTSLVEFPVYLVEVSNCANLARVEVSRKISRFHLRDCGKLKKVAVMNQIGYLQVKRCPKVAIVDNRFHVIYSDIDLN
jgi:Leucine-rich repeat (LRR) protein